MYSVSIQFETKEQLIAYLQGDKTVKTSGGKVDKIETLTPQVEEKEPVASIIDNSAKDAIKYIKEQSPSLETLYAANLRENRTSVKKEIEKAIKDLEPEEEEEGEAPVQQAVNTPPPVPEQTQQNQESSALNAFNKNACIANIQQMISNLKTLGMQDDQIGNEVFIASFQQAGLQPMRVTDLADSDLTRFFPAFKQVVDQKISELSGAGQSGGSFI